MGFVNRLILTNPRLVLWAAFALAFVIGILIGWAIAIISRHEYFRRRADEITQGFITAQSTEIRSWKSTVKERDRVIEKLTVCQKTIQSALDENDVLEVRLS